MSGCANAGQALGRGLKLYTSRSTCSLPFLYQTPTLRRYYSALQDLAKENAPNTDPTLKPRRPVREPTSTSAHATKPEHEDFVPFETPEAAESSVAQHAVQGQSLTGTERYAFAQLDALANAPVKPLVRKRKSADEDTFLSLDDVLNEATVAIEAIEQKKEEAREQNAFSTSSTRKSRKDAIAAAENKQTKSETDVLSLLEAEAQQAATTKPHQTQTEERRQSKRAEQRLLNALNNAPTDTALWSTLESLLFAPIASLHLDTPTPSSSSSQSPKASSRRRNLMRRFPSRLATAASLLRNNFPTSNLILAILPRLKRLGPSAYALATTPNLYNQLLAFHFRKYSDVDACNDLLQEMEDTVIEPNHATLQILNYILDFRESCVRDDKMGEAVKVLYSTEKFKRGFGMLEKWRGKVEVSLAEQEVREQKRLRNEEVKKKEELDLGVGSVRYVES